MTLKAPLPIHSNNLSAIAMTKQPYQNQKTRHIDLKWHHIHQLVENQTVTPVLYRDPEQTADILIKALLHPKFCRHIAELGLLPV